MLLREAVTSPVDPQLVEVGVHDLLADLATDHHVVVCVDDAQWADSGSLRALTFAARRLDRASVQFLLTRRAGFSRTPLRRHSPAGTCAGSSPGRSSLEETARVLRHDLDLTLNPRVLRLVHGSRAATYYSCSKSAGRCCSEASPMPGKPLGVPGEMADMLGLRVRDLPTTSARCSWRSRWTVS